ncbi:TonB-dependent receptor [Glaciecola sp. SC05]|uniref:TonB-dependent receptor n=1 Tax=Glaciecola sp. SC05 TaxID=1987355 RepID=UPI003527D0F8
MNTKRFNKTPLAASLSLILGASLMAPVVAQEATDNAADTEIIEVTGIRGSMIKSMDIKRSSSGIVDAINAEEIGKFPDTNLAESLQRITGISIERTNGEGAQVSARGFGPDRNLVTLNGRQMPTTTGERNFDFSNLAAEGVSGVEVYKTSKADVPTGGIGATINILTHRPLNSPGQQGTFAVEAWDDATSQINGATPQISGLYSITSDDGKFGVALSASYSERDSGSQQANVNFFRSFPGTLSTGPGVPDDETQTNRYGENDIFSVPQNTSYRFEEQQRKRTNAQLTLQYRPMDNLTATLDYTYVSKQNDTQNNIISAWYTYGDTINIWSDGPNVSPLIYSELHNTPTGPADLAIGASAFSVKEGSDSIGLNLEYEYSDNLSFSFDHHESSAEAMPNSPLGSANEIQLRALVRQSTATDFTGERPVLSIVGASTATAEDFQVTGSVFTNNLNESHISQSQFHGEYILEDAGTIDFGIALTHSQNRARSKGIIRNNWGGEGPTGLFSSDQFTSVSVADRFDNMSGGNFDGYTGEVEILANYFEFDFEGVRDIAAANLGVQSAQVGDCGNSFCPSSDYASDRDQYTKEEMAAIYLQYNYEGEFGDMYYDFHLGVRYEKTDVTATSAVPDFVPSALWVGVTEVGLVNRPSRTYGTRDASYDHVLPSFNFNLFPHDDVVLRFAYSETIGRPRYGQMIGGLNVNAGARVDGGIGSTGNPGLLPLESTNIDLSAEWYYDEGSYVSFGYFTKDVENDILTLPEDFTNGIFNPADGPYAEEAALALDINGDPIGDNLQLQREYIFATYGATDPNVYMDNGNIVIAGNPLTDNLLNFKIETPQNVEGSTGYSGFEFAVQHLFGESGFGGIINYTVTDTDNQHDDFLLTPQLAELGISDSANLVAFYEKDGLSVRAAYNWRSKYIVSLVQDGSAGPGPRYIEEYAQIDLTVSYDIPQVEGLSVFLNGINITEENLRVVGRNSNQVLAAIQQGARWGLGVRYSF